MACETNLMLTDQQPPRITPSVLGSSPSKKSPICSSKNQTAATTGDTVALELAALRRTIMLLRAAQEQPGCILTAALGGVGQGPLETPSSATFEPLHPRGQNIPCVATSSLATHTVYQLPIEGVSTLPALVNIVHRFTLRQEVSRPLNQQLVQLAMKKTDLAKTSCEKKDACAALSNRGGYQSHNDLFKGHAAAPFLALRSLVNTAMDELGAEAKAAMYADDESFLRPEDDELHTAYAWLNVNRTAHSNILHRHEMGRWSAVYYVAEGEPNAPGLQCPSSGHMVFRGGPKPGSVCGATYSYMTVRPVPGSLWVFPGSVPHLVMRTVLPLGVTEPSCARISVGVNFYYATPPPPTAMGDLVLNC